MGQVLVCALSTQQWKKMERAPTFEDLIENTPIVHKMMRSATKNWGKNKRGVWSWYFISLNHLKLLIFLHQFFFLTSEKTSNEVIQRKVSDPKKRKSYKYLEEEHPNQKDSKYKSPKVRMHSAIFEQQGGQCGWTVMDKMEE